MIEAHLIDEPSSLPPVPAESTIVAGVGAAADVRSESARERVSYASFRFLPSPSLSISPISSSEMKSGGGPLLFSSGLSNESELGGGERELPRVVFSPRRTGFHSFSLCSFDIVFFPAVSFLLPF